MWSSRDARDEELAEARLRTLSRPEPPVVDPSITWEPSARDLPKARIRSSPRAPMHGFLGPILDRAGVGHSGVKALVVVAVLAAAVGGGLAWSSRPVAEPVPLITTAVPIPPTPAPSQTASVIVHVAGKVRRPGLFTLPAGARVRDALTAAGGAAEGVDMSGLNLARRVVDGEQIVVGRPPAQAQPGQGPADEVVVDLNAATAAQLQELPGVGEVLARRIIEYRDRHSGFRTIDQLRDVPGIGERKFAELRERVRV